LLDSLLQEDDTRYQPMLVKKQMVEVDGGKAGREDLEDHAGWVASTDLLRGQAD
jgi:hypothetical protein